MGSRGTLGISMGFLIMNYYLSRTMQEGVLPPAMTLLSDDPDSDTDDDGADALDLDTADDANMLGSGSSNRSTLTLRFKQLTGVCGCQRSRRPAAQKIGTSPS